MNSNPSTPYRFPATASGLDKEVLCILRVILVLSSTNRRYRVNQYYSKIRDQFRVVTRTTTVQLGGASPKKNHLNWALKVLQTRLRPINGYLPISIRVPASFNPHIRRMTFVDRESWGVRYPLLVQCCTNSGGSPSQRSYPEFGSSSQCWPHSSSIRSRGL